MFFENNKILILPIFPSLYIHHTSNMDFFMFQKRKKKREMNVFFCVHLLKCLPHNETKDHFSLEVWLAYVLDALVYNFKSHKFKSNQPV